MFEYSPINNIKKDTTYPACWITGGLHDPRVAYWEPSKYAATLRHSNPKNINPICLKLDLTVGHFSASDRYKYFREMAVDYSFLLDQLKLA
jgi:oligopeptidase B